MHIVCIVESHDVCLAQQLDLRRVESERVAKMQQRSNESQRMRFMAALASSLETETAIRYLCVGLE